MFARSLLFTLVLLTLNASRAPSDLGAPCVMYKQQRADAGLANYDGGVIPILEGEVKEGANKDFISFGSTDCEDFTCVRDATWVKDAGPLANAQGYCSKVCNLGSTCLAGDPADDNKADRKLSCRALLLDEATLAALCSTNVDGGSGTCAFKSPYFCARGTGPDGGI